MNNEQQPAETMSTAGIYRDKAKQFARLAQTYKDQHENEVAAEFNRLAQKYDAYAKANDKQVVTQ